MPTFPLKVSPNGRYLVDQAGIPFRIHGDSSWDFTHNCSLADIQTYLNDRETKGFNAVLIYYSALSYFVGGNAPWAAKLGGSGAGTAALPFTLNTSGGAWNGDPTFANHDAAFSSPNDSFFEWLGQVIDECSNRGIVCMFFICYQGTSHTSIGDADGWAKTISNSTNTQTVCNTFGQYLANGHGTFQGFKNRKNIIWIIGGDATPANGSELAKRELQILQGMQTAGDTHLVTAHIAHDTLITDQTDWNPSVNVLHSYCSPPTYGMSRGDYALSPARPTFLIETNYWGVAGTRAVTRYVYWAAALTCVGGAMWGFAPFWGFINSADGTSGGSPTVDVFTTAWHTSTAYSVNNYVSHSSNWYRCTAAGTSAGSGGPTGTGTNITDGGVTWTYVAAQSANMGGMANLLSEPAALDMQQLGALLNAIPWYRMVPSGLGGTSGIVTSGGGTQGTWSDGSPISGGTDWIVASAADDGSTLLAYVPAAHSGAFSVDMTRMVALPTAYWVDPTNGVKQTIGAVSNVGTHSFTVPGNNAGGDTDWALLIQAPGAAVAGRVNSPVWA